MKNKYLTVVMCLLLCLILPTPEAAASDNVCHTYQQLYRAMAEDLIETKSGNTFYTSFAPSQFRGESVLEIVRETDFVSGCLCGISFSYVEQPNALYLLQVTYMYPITKPQIQEAEDIAQKLAASLEGKTDFEKIKFAHDYLILNCEYDVGRPGPYNCLLNNKASCTGYALAFQLIMNACGIPCRYTTNSSHAWNTVYVDHFWYNIDVTWDDAGNEIVYDYFLKCNEEFPGHYGAEDANALVSYPYERLSDEQPSVPFSLYLELICRKYWQVLLVCLMFLVVLVFQCLAWRKEKQKNI